MVDAAQSGPPDGLRYRTATDADLDQLARLRWEFHCEDADVLPTESLDQFLATYRSVMHDGLASRTWTAWIAESDERIVAQIFVARFHPLPRPDRGVERYGYMTNVYTLPAHRNQGIGTALLRRVVAWAEANQFAFLMVSPSERSVPFYRRAGFTQHTDWMQRDLRPAE